MSQVLSEQSNAVRSFVSLLRAYSHATRLLNAQLTADHGLTISDYEVLLRLMQASHYVKDPLANLADWNRRLRERRPAS